MVAVGRRRSSRARASAGRRPSVSTLPADVRLACWHASSSARSIGAPVSSLTCRTRGTRVRALERPVKAGAVAVEGNAELLDEERLRRDPGPRARSARRPRASRARRRRARCRRRAARACRPAAARRCRPARSRCWTPRLVGARVTSVTDAPSRAAASAAAQPATPVPRMRTSVVSALIPSTSSSEMSAARDRVRERADRDGVDARLGVGADRVEAHVAGGLEKRRPRGLARDRAPARDGLGGLVVDQDPVGAGGERLGELGLATRPRPRPRVAGAPARAAATARGDAAGQPPVVVLDEDHLGEIVAVVRRRRRRARPAGRRGAGPARSCACRGSGSPSLRPRRRNAASPSRCRTCAAGGSAPRARPSGSRARRPERPRERRRRRRPCTPAAAASSHARSGSSSSNTRRATGSPETTHSDLATSSPRVARARGDGRLGRDVARSDVLGQERAQPLVEIRRPRAVLRRRIHERLYDSSSIRSSGFSAACRSSSGRTISGRSSRRQR